MVKVVPVQISFRPCISAFSREGLSPSTIFSSLLCFQIDTHVPVRNMLRPLYAFSSMAMQGLKGSQTSKAFT